VLDDIWLEVSRLALVTSGSVVSFVADDDMLPSVELTVSTLFR
jgi:hypothetical protein